MLRKLGYFLGWDYQRMFTNVWGLGGFIRDVNAYQRRNRHPTFRIRLRDLRPILHESADPAGSIDSHYFIQDLWAARHIYQVGPKQHTDVGSRMDGFVGHVLVFTDVTCIDIRRLSSTVGGLAFIRDDATRLSFLSDNSVDSLSCLHAAEHFGLGRYGDPVDPDSPFVFMESLQRVLSPGGRLYFSVPVGRERVCFNSQRVFSPRTIMTAFNRLRLIEFSYIDQHSHLHADRDPRSFNGESEGCGLFRFAK